jgi:hypothetical protein
MSHGLSEEDVFGVWSDLSAAVKQPPQWVIENLLPAGVVFLAGPPKAQKTTVEMAMALTVAGIEHTVLPEELRRCPEPGRVMLINAEHTAGELLEMVEDGFRVQVEVANAIMVADEPFQWRLDDHDGGTKLMKWLDFYRPKLFAIDPLRDFHDLDEKESGEMNRLLRPIQRWAKNAGSTALIVHHARKPGGSKEDGDKLYTAADMRGSSALFGLADGVIVLTPRGRAGVHFDVVTKRGGAPWSRTVKLGAWVKPAPEEVKAAVEQATKAAEEGDMQ